MGSEMAQAKGKTPTTNNPLEHDGLCILSLDGGGVRGLSALYILKALMGKVNAERMKDGQPSIKPFQLFDLIGGTSTGGIIAIMLGRLEMDVVECIDAYIEMSQKIFAHKSRLPLNLKGNIQSRFDTAVFGKCIGDILKARGLSETSQLNNSGQRCKVAVCATAVETLSMVLLRSYESSDDLNNMSCTISEAAQATSAATSIFNAVTIKSSGRQFVDGGFGANNPVDRLWNEAQEIWCEDGKFELSQLLKCFVSIGTGHLGKKALDTGILKFFHGTLLSIATESEASAEMFLKRHQKLFEDKRYFRFNVQQGLQDVGLEEFKKGPQINAATTDYMDGQQTKLATRECARNLKQKLSRLEFSPHNIIEWNLRNRLMPNAHPPITFIPFYRNDSLVYREKVFEALEKLLIPSTGGQPIAIWGLGGCGKTQIALEFAYRRQRETSCSVFWVHADSEAAFRKGYSAIGKLAGLPTDLQGDDLLLAVQNWMEERPNWLLILDNADDFRIFKATYSQRQSDQQSLPELYQYIPKSQSGLVIWTSRDKDILGSLVGVNRGVEVGLMTIKECRDLFQQLSGYEEAELLRQDEQLLELLGLLERLPLAVSQAAAYIRKTGVSVRQYLTYFAESEFRQSDLLSLEFQDVHRLEVPNSLMHTWLVSMGRLAQESPLAEELLRVFSLLDNREIPFELVTMAAGRGVKADQILVAIGRLVDYSFLQNNKGVSDDLRTFGQHRLVNLAVRQSIPQTLTGVYGQRALYVMLQLFPDGSHGTWSACETYLPHALKALSWEDSDSYARFAPELLRNVASFYSKNKRSTEAEAIYLKLLRMYEELPGDNKYMKMVAEVHLAKAWSEQNRFEEAERVQLSILEFQEREFGREHDITLRGMSDLAQTWCSQGNLDRAEAKQLHILKVRKELFGDKDKQTIAAMHHLADTWFQQKRLDESEKLMREALKHRMEVFGDMHPDTITAKGNLVNLLSHKDEIPDAEIEKFQIEILEHQKEIMGASHPITLRAMESLAGTRWILGKVDEARWEQARQMFEEIIRLRKDILGDEHPDTKDAIRSLETLFKIPPQTGVPARVKHLILNMDTATLRAFNQEVAAQRLRNQRKASLKNFFKWKGRRNIGQGEGSA